MEMKMKPRSACIQKTDERQRAAASKVRATSGVAR